jgi:hypothetical protein
VPTASKESILHCLETDWAQKVSVQVMPGAKGRFILLLGNKHWLLEQLLICKLHVYRNMDRPSRCYGLQLLTRFLRYYVRVETRNLGCPPTRHVKPRQYFNLTTTPQVARSPSCQPITTISSRSPGSLDNSCTKR